MKKLLSNIDLGIALFIHKNLSGAKLNWVLSRINRGELLLFILVAFIYFHKNEDFGKLFILGYAALCGFLTDRLVLLVKKNILRERPLTKILGKIDSNPDMKHSFPSAHSANSMAVLLVLVYGFGLPAYLLWFSILAGTGRLLSLHHYFSDVAGGWLIGIGTAAASLAILSQATPLLSH